MIYVSINIPHHIPKGSVAGSIRIPLAFLFLSIFSLLGNNWNMSRSRADLYDIFAEENSAFVSKSVSFHSCSVIHLPEIGSPSQKMIEMYLRSG